MLIVVLVQKAARLCIVRWINVDTLYPLPILLPQQIQCLPVLAVHQQAVGHGVQIVETGQQAVGEVWREVAGVQHQSGVGLEKVNPGFASVSPVFPTLAADGTSVNPAGPRPFLRRVHQPGLHRILANIFDRSSKVPFIPDEAVEIIRHPKPASSSQNLVGFVGSEGFPTMYDG